MQHHDGAQAGEVPPGRPVAAPVVAAAQRAVLLDDIEVAAANGNTKRMCAQKYEYNVWRALYSKRWLARRARPVLLDDVEVAAAAQKNVR